MGQEPSTEWKVEKSGAYKSKIGLIMFAIFTPIYLLFVILSVANPSLMGSDIGALNLSIVYGFGLIVLAILLAVIYNQLCSIKERDDDAIIEKQEEDEE